MRSGVRVPGTRRHLGEATIARHLLGLFLIAAASSAACGETDLATTPEVEVREAEPVELVESAPSCRMDVGRGQVTITGTVRANRGLSGVTVQGYLANPGAPRISVGSQSLGAMSAGETKAFEIRASVSGFGSSAQCSVAITWRG